MLLCSGYCNATQARILRARLLAGVIKLARLLAGVIKLARLLAGVIKLACAYKICTVYTVQSIQCILHDAQCT